MHYDPTDDADWKFGMAVMRHFRALVKSGAPPGAMSYYDRVRSAQAATRRMHERKRLVQEEGSDGG